MNAGPGWFPGLRIRRRGTGEAQAGGIRVSAAQVTDIILAAAAASAAADDIAAFASRLAGLPRRWETLAARYRAEAVLHDADSRPAAAATARAYAQQLDRCAAELSSLEVAR